MTMRVDPATAHKILEVDKLRVSYPITGGVFGRKIGEVRAVEDVQSFVESCAVVWPWSRRWSSA